MNPSSHDPAAARILADLAPVQRLARPWKRALPVLALGTLVALAVGFRLGVRHDAGDLGTLTLWGLSALQMGFGALLVGAALRTAVPGRSPARRRTALLLLAGGGLALGVTWLTWFAHASRVPAGFEIRYWTVCFRTPLVIGSPLLLLALALAFRAYPTRPVLTGLLAGLGVGLLVDSSWRTYCEVSDPSHVLTSHTASVVVLAAAGAALAWLAARRQSARATSTWSR